MKKYEKIYNEIIGKINNGVYKVGDSLPSENELSTAFSTSRMTVRQALSELENDGIIIKRQGKESIIVSNTLKPKTILLILPNLFKYIFIDLIKEIEHTLRENGINLLIACSYNDQKIERNIIRNHLGGVDGIMWEPTQAQYTKYVHSNTYNTLNSKPTLCLNTTLDTMNFPYLILNEENAMVTLTNEVLNRGSQKILILAKTDDTQGYGRLQGIKSVLDNSDVEYKTVEFTTYNEERKLFEFENIYFHYKPDTLMFYNDEYANRFLSKYAINPQVDNVIVTGFDNTEFSNGHPNTFLSPNHPKGIMGQDAAKMMIKLLNGQKVDSIVYEPTLDLDK